MQEAEVEIDVEEEYIALKNSDGIAPNNLSVSRLGLKRKCVFKFREKRKLSEISRNFAKLSEISLHEKFSPKFSFSQNFRENSKFLRKFIKKT